MDMKHETPYLQHMKHYRATHETLLCNRDLVYETFLMPHETLLMPHEMHLMQQKPGVLHCWSNCYV
jgi:hypothetical protein